MTKPKVEIAAVCTMSQPPAWWSTIMGRLLVEQQNGVEITRIHSVRTALPDNGKNAHVGGTAPVSHKGRNDKTDANRNKVIGNLVCGEYDPEGFLSSDADWIFWMDDDTVMPKLAISSLLNLGREFVAGVYFTGDDPVIPLMYRKNKFGLYESIMDYPKGGLMPVDAVGMGCTLIHRCVFEDIIKGHTILMRPNGSLFPVPNDIIDGDIPDAGEFIEPAVKDGVYQMPVTLPAGDNRNWPFYSMEYGRTEDMHFCELAANVGHKPYVDTTIICDHLKLGPKNEETFKRYIKEALRGIG